MRSSRVQQSSRILASGLSACLIIAVAAGCSVSNDPSPAASRSRSSCPQFPPVPQGPVAVTGGIAYAVNTAVDKVVWYQVESTGALTKQGEVDADFQPTFIAVHRTRGLVYAANFCSNTVSAYTIGTNGVLTPVKGSPFSTGDQPAAIAVDSIHDFVYVTNFGSDSVWAYKIGANGELTRKHTVTTGGGPDAIEMFSSPTDTFAYVANFKSNTVSAYRVVTTGADAGNLEATVPQTPFRAGSGPNAIAIHPTEPWIYVTNETSNDVWAYQINRTTGNLSELPASSSLPGSPFPTGSGPEGIAVDPSGKFVYVADGLADTVSTYTIDATTGLLKRDPTTLRAIDDPEGVLVDPTGHFVYTVNRNTRDISAFEITDRVTSGVLRFLSNIPL